MEELKLGLEYTFIQWGLGFVGIVVFIYLLMNIFFNRSDFLLSLRNVLRNKRRTFITLIAVSFAFAGTVLLGSYFLNMFSGLRESTIRSQTGHVQLLRKDFLKYGSSAPEEYLIKDTDEIISEIMNDVRLKELVELYMREIRFNGIISSSSDNRSLNFLGRGVDIEQDKILSVLDPFISGTSLRSDDLTHIVLGEGLARQLKIEDGTYVTLLSTAYDGAPNVLDAKVGGIIQSFSKEYGNVIVKTSLEFGQEMVATDGVNKIIFLLNDTFDTAEATSLIVDIVEQHPEWDIEVQDWQDLAEFYVQVHDLFSNIYIIVSVLLFGLVIFLVVNTMTMSIYERFSEFGTLRSIGVKKSKLVILVVLEGIILGILGTSIGLIVANVLGETISALGLDVSAPPGQTRGYPLDIRLYLSQPGFWELIIISFSSIVGITTLSALFPAIKAAKLKIIDAIHTV